MMLSFSREDSDLNLGALGIQNHRGPILGINFKSQRGKLEAEL